MPSPANTASNVSVNLASRSRIRNRNRCARSPVRARSGVVDRPGAAVPPPRDAAPTVRRPARTRSVRPAAATRTPAPRSGTAVERTRPPSCATTAKQQLTTSATGFGTVQGPASSLLRSLLRRGGGRGWGSVDGCAVWPRRLTGRCWGGSTLVGVASVPGEVVAGAGGVVDGAGCVPRVARVLPRGVVMTSSAAARGTCIRGDRVVAERGVTRDSNDHGIRTCLPMSAHLILLGVFFVVGVVGRLPASACRAMCQARPVPQWRERLSRRPAELRSGHGRSRG